MIRRVLSIGVAATALMLQAACGDNTGPQSEFSNARAKWLAHAPGSYSYTVLRGCFCIPDSRGPVTVTVRNGIVESRRYAETGVSVPANFAQYFPTVDEMFSKVDSLRVNNVARLEVKYDAIYGFPVLVDVDVIARIADDEFTYETSGFVVR